MNPRAIYEDAFIIDFEDGTKTIERESIIYNASIEDEYYTVKVGDTIEGISQLKYNTQIPWYIICDANPFIEDIFNLTVGSVLVIPNLNTLK